MVAGGITLKGPRMKPRMKPSNFSGIFPMNSIEQLLCDIAIYLGAKVIGVKLEKGDNSNITGQMTLCLLLADGKYHRFDYNLPKFQPGDDIRLMAIHYLSGFILDRQKE